MVAGSGSATAPAAQVERGDLGQVVLALGRAAFGAGHRTNALLLTGRPASRAGPSPAWQRRRRGFQGRKHRPCKDLSAGPGEDAPTLPAPFPPLAAPLS